MHRHLQFHQTRSEFIRWPLGHPLSKDVRRRGRIQSLSLILKLDEGVSLSSGG